jgi:outer membrane receptor for ferrienterochelin and colicins
LLPPAIAGDENDKTTDEKPKTVEEETVYETEDVVVTGTRTRKLLKDAPVKTELIRADDIEAKGAVSLLDALRFEPGLRIDNVCSVCNTTGVKISGIPARYSLIMIDGMPVFSSLGGVYGLLNISADDIAQVEVVKGASSVLYGTDAIGGVINIITKEPGKKAHGGIQIEGGMFRYKHLSGHASFSSGDMGLSLVATHSSHDSVDRDGDEVSEYAGYVRTTLTGIGHVTVTDSSRASLRLSVLQENRQGGGLGWNGSFLDVFDDVDVRRAFSESILTRRVESALKYIHDLEDGTTLDSSLSLTYHVQDSDYEGEVYAAEQFMAFVQQNAQFQFHPHYDLVAGASYRYEHLDENLAVASYTHHMPGAYVQGDWLIADWLEFVHGARFDYHNEFGPVFTPRVALKIDTLEWMTVRAMFGTGFRAPTTFYEYAHGVRAEGYKFKMDADEPERSINATLSASFDFGRKLGVTLEGAYNRISDPISWETTGDGHIRVFNVDKELEVIGAELQLQSQPLRWLNLSAGYGFYLYDDPGGAMGSAAPAQHITAAANVWFRDFGFKGSMTAELFGPMDLEAVYGTGYNALPGTKIEGWLDEANADLNNPKDKESPWHGVINLRVEQRVWKGLSAHIGVDNLFDYHQNDHETPLYFPADENNQPSPADVIYIWGPLRGRFFYAGIKLEV